MDWTLHPGGGGTAAGVKVSLIQVIMKRYPSLKKSPYVHEIIVCTGRNCAGRDNLKVLQEVKRLLKIGSDGISEDGRVYMKTRACLKQCRTAPNIMVDGKICSGKVQRRLFPWSWAMGRIYK